MIQLAIMGFNKEVPRGMEAGWHLMLSKRFDTSRNLLSRNGRIDESFAANDASI
jgi:hypothetical protein